MAEAEIIFLLDIDVLQGPEGQAGELGLEVVDSEISPDSKVEGHRVKTVSRENQSGGNTDRLEERKL